MTENIDNSAAQEDVPEDIQEDKTEKSEEDEKKKKISYGSYPAFSAELPYHSSSYMADVRFCFRTDASS